MPGKEPDLTIKDLQLVAPCNLAGVKSNMEPENKSLEKEIPFGKHHVAYHNLVSSKENKIFLDIHI